MNLNPDDSLFQDPAWLAFRYVAGEMAPQEAAEFEQRLATDQDARDEVSRAAALCLKLAASSPASLAQQIVVLPRRAANVPAGPRRWLLTAAVTAAILLAGMAGWLTGVRSATAPRAGSGQGLTGGSPGAAPVSPAQAVAWARLRAGGEFQQRTEQQLEDWEPDAVAGISAAADAELPAWLTGLTFAEREP